MLSHAEFAAIRHDLLHNPDAAGFMHTGYDRVPLWVRKGVVAAMLLPNEVVTFVAGIHNLPRVQQPELVYIVTDDAAFFANVDRAMPSGTGVVQVSDVAG